MKIKGLRNSPLVKRSRDWKKEIWQNKMRESDQTSLTPIKFLFWFSFDSIMTAEKNYLSPIYFDGDSTYQSLHVNWRMIYFHACLCMWTNDICIVEIRGKCWIIMDIPWVCERMTYRGSYPPESHTEVPALVCRKAEATFQNNYIYKSFMVHESN